jgi:hypothetical protein
VDDRIGAAEMRNEVVVRNVGRDPARLGELRPGESAGDADD